MHLIISDLRLGGGDALEDFLLWGDKPAGPTDRPAAIAALHEHFTLFLSLRLHVAQRMGLRPRLVLLGNTFNLWQAQRAGESPASALSRIMDAHQPVMAALAHWCEAGGDIDLVIGSHDQPLVDGRAWSLLKSRLPSINASRRGGPAHHLSDAASGLYAEYGHRHDPMHRSRNLTSAESGGAMRRFTRTLLTSLEPMEPWIDKSLVTAELLLVLQQMLDGDARANTSILRGIPALAILMRLARNARRLPSKATPRRFISAARSIARGHAKRAVGPPPPSVRFIVYGHGAAPGRVALQRGVELLSPASWCPVARIIAGEPVMEQPMGYAMLLPDGRGGWEASVRQFAEEISTSS